MMDTDGWWTDISNQFVHSQEEHGWIEEGVNSMRVERILMLALSHATWGLSKSAGSILRFSVLILHFTVFFPTIMRRILATFD